MYKQIEGYRTYLEETEHSPATIKKYLRDVEHYLQATAPEKWFTHAAVVHWREGLMQKNIRQRASIRCLLP